MSGDGGIPRARREVREERGAPSASESRALGEALITYRYLRFGLLAAVVMLAISVLYERYLGPGPDKWLTSLSAYYHTPVRSIFVGALIVIGFSLIVIRGAVNSEDLCLNLAGMFAPVVALVPIAGPTAEAQKVLPESVNVNIRNNMSALFVAGIFAVILILVLRHRGRPKVLTTEDSTGRFTISLGAAILLLAVGVVAFFVWPAFEVRAHYVAAYVMFGFLGAVVVLTGRESPSAGYKKIYRAIWISMAVSALVLTVVIKFDHAVLILEILEIGLFAAFWVVETKEQWHDITA